MDMDTLSLSGENTDKSKKQFAYESIREQIISNKLKPGTMLVERQLCVALNTSRTPVREAIQQLASEGLVNNIATKGSFVSEIRYEDIARLYEVREYLEGLAARLCTLGITDSQLTELREYFDHMNQCINENDHESLFAADTNFHRCIIKNSRNDILINICSNLEGQIRRITRLIDGNAHGIVNAHELHKKILDAIEKHDPDLAEQLMREHIRNSKLNHLKLFAPHILSSTI